jgi:hypothetical protein
LQIKLFHGSQEVVDGPCVRELLGDLKQHASTLEEEGGPGAPVQLTALVTQLDLEQLKAFLAIGSDARDVFGVGFSDVMPSEVVRFTEGNVVAYARLEDIHPPFLFDYQEETHHSPVRAVKFPPPQDININMLPFVMGQRDSLPEEYQQYWNMIESCRVPASELGKIGYLTIHESLVPAGQAQRRPDLHIEAPGLVMTDGQYHGHARMWGCGMVEAKRDPDEDRPRVKGGLYMASNVANSCAVYNVLVKDPAVVVGHNGDLEHIRPLCGKPHNLLKNKLYWLTDKTPHESLRFEEETYRQFFRLVTSALSVWFPEHSTANRLGKVPDSSITEIVNGSKFEKAPVDHR